MTKQVKFKKDCVGFVDENYRNFSKPSFCSHYCEGKCKFFADNIDCDDTGEPSARAD